MDKKLSHIAEKIRSRRAELGMTQKELAGSFVTRNMLSRIENGVALPSVETLLYLSEKLAVDPGYLLSPEADKEAAARTAVLPEMRRLFRNGAYAACLACFHTYCGEPNDEMAFMLAYAALHETYTAIHNGNFDTAQKHIIDAERFADKTVYPTVALRAELALCRAIACNVQSPRLELNEKEYLSLMETAVGTELYMYLTDKTDFPYKNDKYKRHTEARAALRQNRYKEALSVLTELENEKNDADVTAFFLFRLYSDLETVYRELRYFENAYRYSSKRIALLSAFHS